MNTKEVIDKYVAELGDENAFVRKTAAKALGELRAREAKVPLEAALADEDSGVRAETVWALGELMDEDANVGLVEALRNDPDPSVRAAAARALGKMRSRESIEALSDALTDPDWSVRGAASWALGQFGTEKAVAVLSKALGEAYDVIAGYAAEAIKKGARRGEGGAQGETTADVEEIVQEPVEGEVIVGETGPKEPAGEVATQGGQVAERSGPQTGSGAAGEGMPEGAEDVPGVPPDER